MRVRRAAVVTLALCALLAPPSARAYRTTQDAASLAAMGMTGRIAWTASPVSYRIHEAGSADLALGALAPAVDASFAAWAEPSCSALSVTNLGTTPARAAMGDGVNVLVWEETDWSTFGFPSSLLGITFTEVTRAGSGWAITGADMQLNGVDYTWVIEGGHTGTTTIDVQSIVTHEAGHFLGLLHPCEATAFDGAPMCAPLTDPASAPTMFPSYTGETERSLEADDVDGICFLYPRTGCETTRCHAGETCDGAEHCVPIPVDAGVPDSGVVIRGGGGCCGVAGAPRPRSRLSLLTLLTLPTLLAPFRRRSPKRRRPTIDP